MRLPEQLQRKAREAFASLALCLGLFACGEEPDRLPECPQQSSEGRFKLLPISIMQREVGVNIGTTLYNDLWAQLGTSTSELFRWEGTRFVPEPGFDGRGIQAISFGGQRLILGRSLLLRREDDHWIEEFVQPGARPSLVLRADGQRLFAFQGPLPRSTYGAYEDHDGRWQYIAPLPERALRPKDIILKPLFYAFGERILGYTSSTNEGHTWVFRLENGVWQEEPIISDHNFLAPPFWTASEDWIVRDIPRDRADQIPQVEILHREGNAWSTAQILELNVQDAALDGDTLVMSDRVARRIRVYQLRAGRWESEQDLTLPSPLCVNDSWYRSFKISVAVHSNLIAAASLVKPGPIPSAMYWIYSARQ